MFWNKILSPLLVSFVILTACQSDTKPLFTSNESDVCDKILRDTSSSLSKTLAPITHFMDTKTGVYVLEDGGGSLVTRAWLTMYAEKTIDIQYFIFSMDNVGLIACDYLIRAADRGVKIRILVDDFMVDAEGSDILKLAAHPNISIKIYNPGVNLGKNLFSKVKKFATEFRSANQRMHNKTFIVDNKVVITGGRNVADEYFDYDHEYNFRDRDVLLLGVETGVVATSFVEYWESDLSLPIDEIVATDEETTYHPAMYDLLHQYACNPENIWPEIRKEIQQFPATFNQILTAGQLFWVDSVQFVSDDVGKNETTKGLGGGGKTTDALMELIQQAERSIVIQSPYLITTDLSRDLFQEVVDRGVEIRILTNSLASTDNLEAFNGYQRDRKALLNTGVKIFEFRPDAAVRKKVLTGALQRSLDYAPIFGLHSKTMVVDDKITVIGTFNLDPRSANLNTECIAIIHSKEVTKQVMVGIEEEFKPENAWETTLEFNPDKLVKRSKRIKSWSRKVVPKGIL